MDWFIGRAVARLLQLQHQIAVDSCRTVPCCTSKWLVSGLLSFNSESWFYFSFQLLNLTKCSGREVESTTRELRWVRFAEKKDLTQCEPHTLARWLFPGRLYIRVQQWKSYARSTPRAYLKLSVELLETETLQGRTVHKFIWVYLIFISKYSARIHGLKIEPNTNANTNTNTNT